MDNSPSPVSKFDTAQNLVARDKALAIWNSAPVEEIPFPLVIEMIFHAQDSSSGSRAEKQLEAERLILEEANQSYQPVSLLEFRELFRTRKFDEQVVCRWMNSEANLIEMTADAVVEGYPEFLIAATPSNFRDPASLIETNRRRYLDRNPEFGSFESFYSDAGKA